MKRVMVLLKRSAYDLYVSRHQDPAFTSLAAAPNRVIENLIDRHKVHQKSVQKCKEVLNRNSLAWEIKMRDELDKPIGNVDLVITVGGDGTLLQASHFLDNSIPVLGVNSDPTRLEEVEEQMGEYDATRSRGYLCGATADNFEQVLGDILNGRSKARTVQRLAVTIGGKRFETPALNDVLFAHPNPAAVSRLTFSIISNGGESGPLVHTRSSGLRLCTAIGSTAATQSAGGFPMPLQSTDLQYMLREPILSHPRQKHLMHGFIHKGEAMQVTWGCRQGFVYFDGAHLCAPLKFGDVVKLSASGPSLQTFLDESK